MSMILMIGIVAIIAIAVLLVIFGIRDSNEESDPLQARLAEFAARGETATLEEIELSQPFTDRVITPLVRSIGKFTSRFTPQNSLQATAEKLKLAGDPKGLDPAIFWASRFILVAVIAGFLFFIFTIGNVQYSWFKKIIIVVLFSVIGFFIPQLMLNSRISRRQKEIRRSMPDALDLLTICVEAGLGFDGAMVKVYEKWDNELAKEFGRTVKEMQLGKLRREALQNMANRIGIPEMTSFVAAVIQSEQLGVSMAKVLHIQADQMRVKRRQIAEEAAHKAPVKMLIPMIMFIFPTICIVLMTPAVLMLMQSALKGILFGG
jgi:tight adherence protein C